MHHMQNGFGKEEATPKSAYLSFFLSLKFPHFVVAWSPAQKIHFVFGSPLFWNFPPGFPPLPRKWFPLPLPISFPRPPPRPPPRPRSSPTPVASPPVTATTQTGLWLKNAARRTYNECRVRVHLHKTTCAHAHVYVAHVGHKIRVAPKTHTVPQKKIWSDSEFGNHSNLTLKLL